MTARVLGYIAITAAFVCALVWIYGALTAPPQGF